MVTDSLTCRCAGVAPLYIDALACMPPMATAIRLPVRQAVLGRHRGPPPGHQLAQASASWLMLRSVRVSVTGAEIGVLLPGPVAGDQAYRQPSLPSWLRR